MVVILAFVIGGLYAAGIYMMLRRSLVKELIGLSLLSNATNLLIFVAAGLTRGRPPLIDDTGNTAIYADPVPQALILTAIVISFGVTAFTLVLIYRTYRTVNTDDIDKITETHSGPQGQVEHE
jgi:multicomponent Na+:H+ antiporter subunit C